MPRRGLFDYVPPEERSGWLRRVGFAAAVLLMAGGVLTAVVAIVEPGTLSVFVVYRIVPGVVTAGFLLWRWLRQDPRRR
ncbi:MAG TPA: hypothetical protein VFJ85_10490 [Acidimicrobiales bacterium]|nr:hypothetical protein [Acidimicrobiales bacterium]